MTEDPAGETPFAPPAREVASRTEALSAPEMKKAKYELIGPVYALYAIALATVIETFVLMAGSNMTLGINLSIGELLVAIALQLSETPQWGGAIGLLLAGAFAFGAVRVANGSVAIAWTLLIAYGIDSLVAVAIGNALNVITHVLLLIVLVGSIRQVRILREKLRYL
jgi:hypothetical protein